MKPNKRICDDILRYGKIIEDNEFICDGDYVRQYTIIYENNTYLLSKINGEWEFFRRQTI